MTDRLELAERVEKASGPDTTLDAEIAYVADFRTSDGPVRYLHDTAGNSFSDIGSYGREIPAYTRSLDVAMSLVPEGMIFAVTNFGTNGKKPDLSTATAIVGEADDAGAGDPRQAATPALALTAAALRASHSQSR